MNFEIRRRYDRYTEYSRTLAADISKMMECFQKVIPTIFQDYPELAGVSIPSSIKLIDTLVVVPPYSTQISEFSAHLWPCTWVLGSSGSLIAAAASVIC